MIAHLNAKRPEQWSDAEQDRAKQLRMLFNIAFAKSYARHVAGQEAASSHPEQVR